MVQFRKVAEQERGAEEDLSAVGAIQHPAKRRHAGHWKNNRRGPMSLAGAASSRLQSPEEQVANLPMMMVRLSGQVAVSGGGAMGIRLDQ